VNKLPKVVASVTKQHNLAPVVGQQCPVTGKVIVGLALHHRLQWFIHLRAHGLSKGDEHPTNTPHGVWYSFFYSRRQMTLFWPTMYLANRVLYSTKGSVKNTIQQQLKQT